MTKMRQRAEERLMQLAITNCGFAGGDGYRDLHRSLSALNDGRDANE